MIFKEMESKGHEQIVFCYDSASGLKAIIAIHNTVLGPALGGCRMWPYRDEAEALNDALRLSRGMTYKAAVAGLKLGGGKSVIIGDPKTMKTEELFRAFGRFVETLAGRYITAEDVGTSVHDMEWVRMETDHVCGCSRDMGGSGDPGPLTAIGVYHGIRRALLKVFGTDALAGRTIAIQGVGHVGFHLIEHLLKAGGKVVISDIDFEKAKNTVAHYESITAVPADEIYDVECDVFAPCALGGSVNEKTIPRLRCKIVAGSANNVLLDEDADERKLRERNILYIPDYVINSGGVINVYSEVEGFDEKQALTKIEGIFDTVGRLLDIAERENISTLEAANSLAKSRIEKEAANLKRTNNMR